MALNIEEERKAFIETLKPRLIEYFGCGAFSEGADKDTFDAPGVQFFFEGWLAAKEHAEEMAKPTVKVTCDFDGEFWLTSLNGRVGPGVEGGFETKEAAIQWATVYGFRVIE